MKALLQLFLLFSILTSQLSAFLPLSYRLDASNVCRSPPKARTLNKFAFKHQQDNNRQQQDGECQNLPNRPTQRRKRLRSWLLRSLTALAIFFRSMTGSPVIAQAKFSSELSQNPSYSIRPGMNSEQAQKLLSGEASLEEVLPDSPFASSPDSPFASSQPKPAKSQSSKNLYKDYIDDEDDDGFSELLEEAPQVPTVERRLLGSRSTVPELPKNKLKQFAAAHQEKDPRLYAKVAAALFVPTFGGMFIREHLRLHREEVYVRKGLAILEQQKREYFNITDTEGDDSDVKQLNTTDTDDNDDDGDDDDDNEDDDDDDDDPPQPSRGRPKRPRGGGSGGDKGGGGVDNEGGESGNNYGYGRPSDDDLDKLNQLFRKS